MDVKMIVASALILSALIFFILVVIRRQIGKICESPIDKIHSLASAKPGSSSRYLNVNAPQAVNAKRGIPTTPFSKTPAELKKLKQRLSQLKYSRSVGAVSGADFAKEKSEISGKMRDAQYRR